MSVYEKSIQAFIEVLESEPRLEPESRLLSNKDWDDLKELASNLSEEPEEISAEIQKWLKLESRSKIQDAYKKQRKKLSSSSSIDLDTDLGIGNTQSPTPPNQPSPSARELVNNSIKKNSPSSESPPSQPKP